MEVFKHENSKLRSLMLVFFLTISGSFLTAQDTQLKVNEEGGKYILQLIDKHGNVGLQVSPKGMWSVATAWGEEWAENWHYGYPEKREELNGHIILSGKISLKEGDLLVRDAYKQETGRVKCTRRYQWTGKTPLDSVTLAIQYLIPAKNRKLFMPGIMYYGNPSGAKSGRTPVWEGKDGELALFEEHRFPMPLVSMEWGGKQMQGAALHSIPSLVAGANKADQWWSLGAEVQGEGTLLSIYSGPCAFNGHKSVIKTHQGKKRSMFSAYDNAFLRMAPGAIIEKTFFLETYTVDKAGSSFQTPLYSSIDIFNPAIDDLPEYKDIVEQKINYAESRWIEGEHYAGYNQFSGETGKEYIVLGWVGQAAAPGYAYQHLYRRVNNDTLLAKAQKSLDFVSSATMGEQGLNTWYHLGENVWGQRIWGANPELLSQGQVMFNVAQAIKSSETSGLNPEKWKQFLQKSADYHSQRILKKEWNPESTDEAFFIAPLCLAYEILNDSQYKKAALKAARHYAQRHLSMNEVYWGGTLDAVCEDKEGAFAAFQGFLSLFELTKEEQYLQWAKHACDVVISYTYVWDVDLPAGRLRDHHFKTRGWTSVSVQNMHIDVFGVLIAPFVYKLGDYLEDERLKQLSKLMYVSCGQLIDPYGSQGEQPQQTNYTQDGGAPDNYLKYRGNYVEDWTVFWITAHFLTGAAMFEEMGVMF